MKFLVTLPYTQAMASPTGLRERKKERTRALIAETARRLFVERGFEAVSVAEIARAAEVSEATVYNYFPTKEELVYNRLEAFEEEMLAAVRERAAGESIAAAFGRFISRPRGLLASRDPAEVEELARISRMIASSPALLARERQIFDAYTDSLATVIAKETGGPADAIEPWVVANALLGIHRAGVDDARRRIVAGARNPGLARSVRRHLTSALAALDHGLADYGAAPT
jgi:AcrR family transcriptional regulator